MKICSKCHIEKEDSEFNRWKVCKKCMAKRQRERTKVERATPEGRAKHNKWANEFHKRHREKCLAYARERRKTPEYKAYMKAYRKARKEKIYQQEVITKRRYLEKNRDSVSDEYCIAKIREQQKITREEITAEMIEIKRIQVLIKRLKNNVAKIKKEHK